MTMKGGEINVKISDFGFSKKCEEISLDDEPCGTPLYVAPEILRGDGYGPEADMWSAGVLSYILHVGYAPFYHEEQFVLFRKIKKGVFKYHDEYWKNISDDCKNLISTLLVINPFERCNASDALNSLYFKDNSELELHEAVKNLKKIEALRKMKKVALGIIITNRLSKVTVNTNAVGNRSPSRINIKCIEQLQTDKDDENQDDNDDEIKIIKKEVNETIEEVNSEN